MLNRDHRSRIITSSEHPKSVEKWSFKLRNEISDMRVGMEVGIPCSGLCHQDGVYIYHSCFP